MDVASRWVPDARLRQAAGSLQRDWTRCACGGMKRSHRAAVCRAQPGGAPGAARLVTIGGARPAGGPWENQRMTPLFPQLQAAFDRERKDARAARPADAASA